MACNAARADGVLPLNTSAAAGIRRRQKRCANRGSRQYRQRRRLRRSSRHSSPSKSSDEDEDNLASRNQATGIGRVNAPGNVAAVSSANHSASMLQDASLPIGTAMLRGSTVYVLPGITSE